MRLRLFSWLSSIKNAQTEIFKIFQNTFRESASTYKPSVFQTVHERENTEILIVYLLYTLHFSSVLDFN